MGNSTMAENSPYQALMQSKAEEALAQTIPAKLESIPTLTATLFTFGSLAEANDSFIKAVEAKTAEADPKSTDLNPVLTSAIVAARDELATLTETLITLEAWLQLSVPTIADGNNFGVEIQEFAVKTLAEKKKAVKDLFDGLNAYSTTRGDLWGKTIFPVVNTKKSSKGSNKSTGGEKGDTAGTSESEDVSTAYNMVVSDAVVAIAGHDTQHYFNLKMIFQEIWKTYAVVHDLVTKNQEKLTNPRNDAGGSSGGNISMF